MRKHINNIPKTLFKFFWYITGNFKAEMMLNPFIWLITELIGIYSFIVLLAVIVSLLSSFDMINRNNIYVYKITKILEKLTEPILSRIRKIIPPIAGIDFSPVFLLLGLTFISKTILYYFSSPLRF